MLGLFAVMSFDRGRLYDRVGAKATIDRGLRLPRRRAVPALADRRRRRLRALVPGLAVTGIGVGLFYPSITTAAVTALDQARSSLAGGLIYMFQIAGGAIGLGLTTAIFKTVSENEVAEKASAAGTRSPSRSRTSSTACSPAPTRASRPSSSSAPPAPTARSRSSATRSSPGSRQASGSSPRSPSSAS